MHLLCSEKLTDWEEVYEPSPRLHDLCSQLEDLVHQVNEIVVVLCDSPSIGYT